jgi:putative ABC transport system ATP-binding protein
MKLIEIVDISKTYKSGSSQIDALKDINLAFRSGDTVAIVGPSGSGKSTLLNMIGALDEPDSGEIKIHGKSIIGMNEEEGNLFRRNTIGFVFQMHNLVSYLTASENVELPLIACGMNPDKRTKRVDELLEEVGLDHRQEHYPEQLSGGEQQRVAIARAMANKPQIILADEPTGQLDSVTGLAILELLRAIVSKNDGILLIASHNQIVADIMNKQIHLMDGKVITH